MFQEPVEPNVRFYGFIDTVLSILTHSSLDNSINNGDIENSLEKAAMNIILNCICAPVHRVCILFL